MRGFPGRLGQGVKYRLCGRREGKRGFADPRQHQNACPKLVAPGVGMLLDQALFAEGRQQPVRCCLVVTSQSRTFAKPDLGPRDRENSQQ
jgi:hypothetical protein